jgi:APA family basic amino acid/polyamine antiporter
VLEYTVAAAAVAVGWSAHVSAFLAAAGWSLPPALSHGLFAGGILDLPAIVIGVVVTVLLIIGTRESANINFILVCIKLAALVLFVVLASTTFDLSRFHPFAPYGFGAHVDADGVKRGVLAAAAIIFFAFYGFDAVSTAAEETINPARDLTIGIIGSMILCTVIYIAVAAAALGASSYIALASSAAPLVHVLELLRHPLASQLVAAAAIVALPTVILVLMYGQSRIWYVMARDGLLPESLAALHKTRGTPVIMTIVSGAAVVGLATTLPLANIALLANAGTLAAFIAVALSLLVLRIREPSRTRIFRAPLGKGVAVLCIAGCVYLFASGLPAFTQIWFVFWNAMGLIVYFAYGARKSRLATA